MREGDGYCGQEGDDDSGRCWKIPFVVKGEGSRIGGDSRSLTEAGVVDGPTWDGEGRVGAGALGASVGRAASGESQVARRKGWQGRVLKMARRDVLCQGRKSKSNEVWEVNSRKKNRC